MRLPRTVEVTIGGGVLALTVLAAGCGPGAPVGRDRTLQLAVTEYRLNPQSARLPAGRVTIAVRNFGRLTHNLVVSRGGHSIASTRAIGPGQSTRLTLAVTRGTYLMASTILSDQALGEYGTLSVTR